MRPHRRQTDGGGHLLAAIVEHSLVTLDLLLLNLRKLEVVIQTHGFVLVTDLIHRWIGTMVTLHCGSVQHSKAVSVIRCGQVYSKVQCVSTARHQNGPSRFTRYPFLLGIFISPRFSAGWPG